ncbi:MAG: ribosome maturation factor RimM [Bacteroidota bacterium]
MHRSDCVEIGYVAKAHGLKGEVKIILDVHDTQEYRDIPLIFLGKGDKPLKPYQIESFHHHKQKEFLLAFVGVDTREASEDLVGHALYFPIEELPPLEDGHFYYFQVIGFDVVDKERGKLGTVRDFADGAAQDVLIMTYQGKDVLIPVVEPVMGLADFEKKAVYVDLPDGLLEVYLGE